MTFSGSPGTIRSQAGNMVAGFGSSSVKNSQTFTASMTASASTPTTVHTYIFTIVSSSLYRAVSKAKDFISVFRTQ